MQITKQKQFNTLFFTELWERFAFYGLQAIFMLFVIKAKLPSGITPYMLFGIFSALLYVMPTIAGYFADHFFGIKRSLVVGGVCLSIGYGLLTLAHQYEVLLIALAFIIMGNGLFKPSPAALISIMSAGDARESKRLFTWYYMAINLGSLPALLFIPKIASYSFNVAFLLCMLGMLLGLFYFFFNYAWFKSLGNHADEELLSVRKCLMITAFLLIGLASNYVLLHFPSITFYLVLGAGLIIFIFLFFLRAEHTSLSARMLHIIGIILLIEMIVFWIIYNQMFSTIVLFAEHNVNLMIFGYRLLPGNLLVADTLGILLLGPCMAALYHWLAKKQWKVIIPYKFSLGIIISGLSVLILPAACRWFAVNSHINLFWVVGALILFALGELLVSAMGLSMVSLYFSKRINTFVMGVFWITVSIASALTGKLAQLFAVVPKYISAAKSLTIYIDYFFWLGIGTVGLGLVYCVIALCMTLIAKKKKVILH